MTTTKNNNDTTALSVQEQLEITAGESLWYWAFYSVGYTSRCFVSFLEGFRDSEKSMGGLK
jgi:hypothetical protein